MNRLIDGMRGINLEKMVKWMLRLRGLVLILFLAAAVLCGIMTFQVRTNYDMIDYLPDEAPSTIALDVMDESYEKSVPNLRVMVRDVSIPEALDYKERIKALPGVEDINWLDDQVDIKVPLEVQSQKTVEDWYKDKNALFSIVVSEAEQQQTLAQIRELIGEEGAMSGNPVDTVNAQVSTSAEIKHMMSIIIPLMFAILLFTTSSWFEPVLFMLNVGVAIVLNMGTNLIFGEISFITKTTGAILQLACSMDYAIFLVDRFEEIRREGYEAIDAMSIAVSKSAASILSSGLTTVVGFAALIAMRFKIGPDMGYVLSKGIVISLLVTLLFMPCLTMCCYKLIDRTQHRSFMPTFERTARWADRAKGFVTICLLVCLIPSYLAQKQISFMYGMSGMAAPGSQVVNDRDAINDLFGESASYALLLPKGNSANEQELNDALKALPEVSSVLSFVENVGRSIPEQYVPKESLKMLNSDEYTRMVVMARVPPESEKTFAFVEKLRELAGTYYPEGYHLAGETANVYDMKDTITADSIKVNLISIGAIALILLLTFHSFTLPFFLLLTIESSIFLNLAVPYFTGQTLNYIGYLIISSVQLGATVDYAILFTNRYLENRAEMPKKQCAARTIQDTAGSILTSGGILTSAGLVLGLISTNGVISQLGILIARGAVLSAILVLVFLPSMLANMEPVIKRTTRKLHFYTLAENREEVQA